MIKPPHSAGEKLRVCFVSTYAPRQCGIATFTRDLVHAVTGTERDVCSSVVAVSRTEKEHRYPPEVTFEIQQDRLRDYCRAADYVSASDAHVVCLQHEFGIFGGSYGGYISRFLKKVSRPVITTLHTIMSRPSNPYRRMLTAIAEASHHLVVLNDRARPILRNVYGISEDKVSLIHHGVPDVPLQDSSVYKSGAEGRLVVLTSGFLSRAKGIELMLEALPAVARRHPEVLYLVVGTTHPEVRRRRGEEYRDSLQDRVRRLGLEGHVVFHDRYVDFDELCAFIGASDIYVTPYRSKEQIVSGTLAYAVGMGKAIVSTPYPYAQELLSDGRGRLVDFDDARGLAQALNDLISNETARRQMRHRAYEYGRSMIWPNVGRRYLELFDRLLPVSSLHGEGFSHVVPTNGTYVP